MDITLFKWILRLTVVVIIIECVLFIYCNRTQYTLRNETNMDLSQLRCATIRQKFSIITPASSNISVDFESFSEQVSELLRCPHISNTTLMELNREMLRSCCNATGLLYMTKKNTDAHKNIPYESNKYPSYKMNNATYNMLPEDFPWNGRRLGHCAVVGSGGILKNSSCGREIDRADYVMRFNLAPINEKDVGLKSSLITVNPSQIKYSKREEKEFGPLTERVSAYGNATLIIPAFATPLNTRLSFSAMKTLQPLRPKVQVAFYSTYYLKTLHNFWKGHGLNEQRHSSGFMLVNVALEVCDHVDIYGFWPFSLNLQQQPLSRHYYNNAIPIRSLHSMPDEFLRLLQLHSQQLLTMHLHPCL